MRHVIKLSWISQQWPFHEALKMIKLQGHLSSFHQSFPKIPFIQKDPSHFFSFQKKELKLTYFAPKWKDFTPWIWISNVNSVESQNGPQIGHEGMFTGSPITWPLFSHSPKIWALFKHDLRSRVHHFPVLSDEKLYLFKKRTNLLPHSWRLTVKIVCDKEFNPLHFFRGHHFCASITFTKQA